MGNGREDLPRDRGADSRSIVQDEVFAGALIHRLSALEAWIPTAAMRGEWEARRSGG
jgi:hypothetical protein